MFTKASSRLDLAHGECALHRANQERFSGCLCSSQCKEKPGTSLPPQYALELLTVYAWERDGEKAEFKTAQGFQTVLELVQNYQKLCIYWTKYYNFENPVIGDYLRRQLSKPRYLSPQGSAPVVDGRRCAAGLPRTRGRGRAPRSLTVFCCQSSCYPLAAAI